MKRKKFLKSILVVGAFLVIPLTIGAGNNYNTIQTLINNTKQNISGEIFRFSYLLLTT